MNIVEPIRKRVQVLLIKSNLEKQDNPRDYLLFTLGVNSGLRISDILPLRLKDVIDDEANPRDFIWVKIRKTGKPMKIPFNKSIKDAIRLYCEKSQIVNLNSYLFISERKRRGNGSKPLSKVRCWQLVQEWTRAVGIKKERMGCHSLRKTFGYMMRMQGVPIERISKMLGHTNTKVTFRYLGIDDDEIEQDINNFNL